MLPSRRAAASDSRPYWRPALVGIALAIWCVTLVNPRLGIQMSVFYAALLVWRAQPDILLPLLILVALPSDFGSNPGNKTAAFVILKMPMTARLSITCAVPMRIMAGFATETSLHTRRNLLLIAIWLGALVPVAIGTYHGWTAELSNWSRPIRFLLSASAFFYGFVLAKRSPDASGRVFSLVCLPMAALLLLLHVLSLFDEHVVYFLVGIASAGVPFLWSYRRRSLRLFALVLMFNVVGSFRVGSFTDTLMILWGVSLAMGATYYQSKRALSLTTGVIALVLVGLFVGGVVYRTHRLGPELAETYSLTQGRLLQEKVFADRAVLWEAAFDQILAGPFAVVLAGRPMMLQIGDRTVEWSVGAHNAILESFRVMGVFGGMAMVVLSFVAVSGLFRIAGASRDTSLRVLAASIAAVGLTGLTAGDFVFDQSVAFWFWMFAGFAHSQFIRERALGRVGAPASDATTTRRRLVVPRRSPAPVPSQS